MIKIIPAVLLLLVSTFAIAQQSTDSIRKEAVQSTKEKFSRTTFLNFEYSQSLDRSISSELFDQDFQEGDIKSQRNFIVSTNIPVYKTRKWSLKASATYQFNKFEFENIKNTLASTVFEQNGIVDYHKFSTTLSSTYFSTLFRKPVIYNASIIVDGNDAGFGRIKGLVGLSFILKRTERTTISVGAFGFIDPTRQIPFFPTFTYNHKLKNSKWELDFILPERLLLCRPVGENGRLSLGNSLGSTGFYVNVNNQAFGDIFEYNQKEIKTGIIYEYRFNDYLLGTFQGGLQNFISNRLTEKGEPVKNFIYKNKQDPTTYFQIGISIVPLSKKKSY